ncbi:precorrin-6A synthase (deacetylating) [Azotobacter chroococcum]|uniref:Precorrin-6A synthase (Deacetylating) n=2 Tax=Azotobacter chroococcum TaxID=353 RepID=A0A0C4WSS6_9GAMM|nr:precorrin-6A synthase (deacetylating) [Azotobacter chroococcum]AJE23766.1 Precorrin-6A synthase (Deacetylating) [Azotobacter chroococcum NCIMB 8003]ASL28809.1 precorrin 6A synthase [Azotobacter chroococcum]QQE91232.1 precorrin-6A synthase (deacetylating) [Azotobacter chroococcum]TKD43386.1 precorrin-6A synthase (deacetylating) [Azotobacter chroococcum]
MKHILIIGIGAGDPDYLTVQAIKALNRADVFFVMDKGPAKEKLVALRKEICRRYIEDDDYRIVEATCPERVRDVSDYRASVDDLNADKQAVFERLIAEELADGECGAFLVWGDPALYDSTIRIVEAIARSGRHVLDFEVIPGISSIQALVAKHRTTLNSIGQALEITPARRLAEGFPERLDSVLVMLDAKNTYKRFVGEDMDIFWGAYVGTPDEILIGGRLAEVADEIEQVRAEARSRHGWIMDTYLLRRRVGE